MLIKHLSACQLMDYAMKTMSTVWRRRTKQEQIGLNWFHPTSLVNYKELKMESMDGVWRKPRAWKCWTEWWAHFRALAWLVILSQSPLFCQSATASCSVAWNNMFTGLRRSSSPPVNYVMEGQWVIGQRAAGPCRQAKEQVPVPSLNYHGKRSQSTSR